MTNYPKDNLITFVRQVFLACGMKKDDAGAGADALISADLRGIDSHGVARLSGYVRLHEAGRANMSPNWRIIHETPSTATIDADMGLGLVVASTAMDIAINKAANVGTGWVAIQNSNHFGIAGFHAMKALRHNMIGIAMTNASPLVAPTASKERMLGTNPMCFAFPAGGQQPVVIDMATSAAANGKLEIAERKGKNIPYGWVVDKNGNPSDNPTALKQGGMLLPLGTGSEGGHKGYALAAAVDIFSGVLSGANYGPWVPPFVSFLAPIPNLPGKGVGHFVGAMRIDAFRPAAEFKENMDNWINRFKNSIPVMTDQPVMVPGEPEWMMESARTKTGIPLNDRVVEDLNLLATKFHIEPPHPIA